MQSFEMQVFEILGWMFILSGAYGLVCDFIVLLVEKAKWKLTDFIKLDVVEFKKKPAKKPLTLFEDFWKPKEEK